MSKQSRKGQRQNEGQQRVAGETRDAQDAPKEHPDEHTVGEMGAMVNADERVESVEGNENGGAFGMADGTAGLAVLLGYLVAYLGNRVDVDDLDVMSFSLHHLFCCVDSLYRVALPTLAIALVPSSNGGNGSGDGEAGNVYRPRTWIQLQALRRIVRRMQPLCQLLVDAGERILTSLGSPVQAGSTPMESDRVDETDKGSATVKCASSILLKKDSGEGEGANEQEDVYEEPGPGYLGYTGYPEYSGYSGYAASSDGMGLALHDMAAILATWQQRYCNLPSFKTLLCELFPTIPLTISPDAPFIQLLDSASILFGDILPAFQAVSTGDDEAVIMLLYDFLQQTDLLELQFETILELLNTLIAQYTLAVSSSSLHVHA